MRVSNSKIKTWNRCHKQFEFKYIMGLRPKQRKFHLELGSWVHDLLMTRADGENWKARHRILKTKFDNLFEEEKEDLGDLPAEAKRLFTSYLRTYKKIDVDHRVIDTEMDEIITLPSGHEFNFIIDEIYEDAEGLWLRDHKTVSKFMPKDFMLLDAQLTRYFYCAEKMGYTPLMGVEFNEIRTKAPTVPHRNKNGRLSEAKNIDTDYWTYLAAIKGLEQDPKTYKETLRRLWEQDEKFFRRSRLPKDQPVTETMMAELDECIVEIEDAKAYPRSPDKSCEWMCDYKDLCIIDLHGGDISKTIKHRYETRKRSRKDDE
jgi:hypothetical protein